MGLVLGISFRHHKRIPTLSLSRSFLFILPLLRAYTERKDITSSNYREEVAELYRARRGMAGVRKRGRILLAELRTFFFFLSYPRLRSSASEQRSACDCVTVLYLSMPIGTVSSVSSAGYCAEGSRYDWSFLYLLSPLLCRCEPHGMCHTTLWLPRCVRPVVTRSSPISLKEDGSTSFLIPSILVSFT